MKQLLTALLFAGLLPIASAQNLPDFNLASLAGDTITSQSLTGKNVYINIWETWCEPCVAEIPVLNELKEKYPDVVFLAITPANSAKAKRLLKKYPFNFPVVCEAGDLVKQLIKGGYPTHVFVDSSGKLTTMVGGASISYTTNEKPSREEIKKRLNEANYERLNNALRAHLGGE